MSMRRAVLVFALLPIAACLPANEVESTMEAMQGNVPAPMPVAASPATAALTADAASDDPEQLAGLPAKLTDRALLATLNTEQELHALPAASLQLHFVLDALAGNPHAAAATAFDALAAAPMYQQPGPFLTLLLQASARAVSPGPALQSLWQIQLTPDATELDLTVAILLDNGSAAAIDVLEHALLSNAYREDYVVAWLRDPLLRHRQDLPALQMCSRLLASDWSSTLKGVLVDVLFEYRPDEWYRHDTTPPAPPPRAALTEPARALLLDMARAARGQRLLGRQRYNAAEAELLDRG